VKAKAFPIIVKRGSASVKIYRPPLRGVDRFTIALRLDNVRKRQTFGDLEAAKTETAAATRLTNGECGARNGIVSKERTDSFTLAYSINH
jgi:hypothetical protein